MSTSSARQVEVFGLHIRLVGALDAATGYSRDDAYRVQELLWEEKGIESAFSHGVISCSVLGLPLYVQSCRVSINGRMEDVA